MQEWECCHVESNALLSVLPSKPCRWWDNLPELQLSGDSQYDVQGVGGAPLPVCGAGPAREVRERFRLVDERWETFTSAETARTSTVRTRTTVTAAVGFASMGTVENREVCVISDLSLLLRSVLQPGVWRGDVPGWWQPRLLLQPRGRSVRLHGLDCRQQQAAGAGGQVLTADVSWITFSNNSNK